MLSRLLVFTALIGILLNTACNSTPKETAKEPSYKEENIQYTGDGVTMNGYRCMMKTIAAKDQLFSLFMNGGV
jgi:hypothetical protein